MELTISGLQKRYGDITALAHCDLHITSGELLGFLGPNGAGKTTTMRSILGLVKVDAGSITWDGQPVGRDHRRRIGYMPQERGLYARMKVKEQIVYVGSLAGLDKAEAERRADRWIERVGLTERADDLVEELSTGNKQRVQLAVALVHEPELLVLDEPFAGLDPVAVSTMTDVMLDRVSDGAAVVFSSHQLDLVQDACERVTIIAKGRTVASAPVAELRERSEHRELAITWAHPSPAWTPMFSATQQPSALSPNVTRLDVARDLDPAVALADANAHGTVVGFSFEPPGLDSVFLELVDSDGEPAESNSAEVLK